MNLEKVSQMMKIALLVICLLFQQTLAISLTKDLLLLGFLAKILKPRFVPLPIPLPFPLKFTKQTHKPYAVPLHSHSLSAHEVGHGHLPLSYGVSGPSYGGASYGGSSYGGSSYGGLSYGGSSYGGSSYGGSSYGKLSSVSSLDYAELKEIEKFLAQLDLKEKLKNSASLSSVSDLSDAYSKLNEVHSSPDIDSLSDDSDDHSDLLYGSTSDIGKTTYDDIEKIGGLDVLTDIDGLGSSKKWW